MCDLFKKCVLTSHCAMPTLLLYCADGSRVVHHGPPTQSLDSGTHQGHHPPVPRVWTSCSFIVFRILNTCEHIGFKGARSFDHPKEALGVKMFRRPGVPASRPTVLQNGLSSLVRKCSNISLPTSPSLGLFQMPAISFPVRAFSLSPSASFLEVGFLELTVF